MVFLHPICYNLKISLSFICNHSYCLFISQKAFQLLLHSIGLCGVHIWLSELTDSFTNTVKHMGTYLWNWKCKTKNVSVRKHILTIFRTLILWLCFIFSIGIFSQWHSLCRLAKILCQWIIPTIFLLMLQLPKILTDR